MDFNIHHKQESEFNQAAEIFSTIKTSVLSTQEVNKNTINSSKRNQNPNANTDKRIGPVDWNLDT
jgi:hypothetical protein